MHLIPLRTPLVQQGDVLLSVVLAALSAAGAAPLADGVAPLVEGDVLCITSKIVSVAQGRVVDLTKLPPPPADWLDALSARFGVPLPPPDELAYAKAFAASPALAALALGEAEAVFVESSDMGRSPDRAPDFVRAPDIVRGRVYYTCMDGTWIANAGVDQSNTPAGTAILWPRDPWGWAREMWTRLRDAVGITELGVVLTDSRVTHLRRGITGAAIAWAGFEGVQSEIGQPDLYGRPLRVTERALADDLAAAAALLSGEGAERTPLTLVRGAGLNFTDRPMSRAEVAVDPDDDLYAGIYAPAFRRLRPRRD